MEGKLYTEYSAKLNRDMTFQIYGEKGRLCFVFPSQDGRYFDYANFGMVDELAPFLEKGQLRLICVDGIDKETWSGYDLPPRERTEKQEKYYSYITEELYPRVQEITGERTPAIATGCSMGAIHAAIFFFRRPDLFDTLIALSGAYEAKYFFGDYMDDLLYQSSVVTFLRNMPLTHPYIEKYNHSNIIVCVGQGSWEEDMVEGTKTLQAVLNEKGIHAWVDYWGYDVAHDWCWWKKQIVYFMEKVLNAKSAS